MLRYIDRPLALLLLFDIVVVVAYVYLEQRWLALPNLPLSIGGGPLGVRANFTRWSVIKDLRDRVLYFRGYDSHAFRAIHLPKLDLRPDAKRFSFPIPMGGGIIDITEYLKH